jgi:hypothetical protein
MNGEDFDPPEGETMLALQHLQGHMKQKEEKYDQLSEEHRPNFDAHLFKTIINYMKFIRNIQQETISNAMAGNMIMNQPQQPQGQVPAQTPVAPIQTGQPGQEGIIPNA